MWMIIRFSEALSSIIRLIVYISILISTSIGAMIIAVFLCLSISAFKSIKRSKDRKIERPELIEGERKLSYFESLLFSPQVAKEIHTFNLSHYMKEEWKSKFQEINVGTAVSNFYESTVYLELLDDFESLRGKDNSPYTESDSKINKDYVVELKNVSFSYDDGKTYALKKVNLAIKKRQVVAIVGENSAGKTTLAKLILGLYKPSSGEVILGKGMLKEGQRPKITAVFQDFTKYLLTLRHNVGFGETAFMNNDDKIYGVLEKVNIAETDYYMRLDEQIGPQFGGRDFSHGQWQKIAVARGSFRRNHGLAVLDEPTASLDPITESRTIQSFIDLIGGSTCIFVSHRLSSVKLADRIIVMKDGRIIEEGTHKELMALGGEYYRMFHEQAKLYD